ncbi:WecB/TagA/CpsF family glycosyltransferase, partial [bacterium]|nr:WecB/TagA/CpsF family glycosyltransferase [bacterium]
GVALGIGGSFDVLCGDLKRAPRIMRKSGLEWLFRLGQEPWRIRRLLRMVKFARIILYSPK